MVHIESADGEDILTFTPAKAYQSVVVCSPDLKEGSTYGVYAGGSSTGTVADGLYAGGDLHRRHSGNRGDDLGHRLLCGLLQSRSARRQVPERHAAVN